MRASVGHDLVRIPNSPPLQYADPVTDLLDQHGVIRARLFREHCVYHMGNFVKVSVVVLLLLLLLLL